MLRSLLSRELVDETNTLRYELQKPLPPNRVPCPGFNQDYKLSLKQNFTNALKALEAHRISENNQDFNHANSLKLQPPPPIFPHTYTFQVVFLEFDDDCYAYFHINCPDNWTTYVDHMLEMRDDYLELDSTHAVPCDQLFEGASVIAKVGTEDRGEYFVRASVLDEDFGEGLIHCLNIDERTEFIVSTEQIFYPSEHAMKLPARAVQCVIQGLDLSIDVDTVREAMGRIDLQFGSHLKATLIMKRFGHYVPALKVETFKDEDVAEKIMEEIALHF